MHAESAGGNIIIICVYAIILKAYEIYQAVERTKLTDLMVRGEDQLAVEFQLQLVQFVARLPPVKLGAVPLQAELPLLQPVLAGPQLQLVVGSF